MSSAYDNLMRIVDAETPSEQRLTAIRGFAEELDWTPSYEFRGSFGVPNAEDHLVVEHGLENSAIISFLRAPTRAADLDSAQMRNLLSISYNNLVEWHIFVSETEVRYVNNLSPQNEKLHPLTRSNFSTFLSGQHFDDVTRDTSTRGSLQACDDIFIQIISRWKRLIKADYRDEVENKHISALFNSLIFVRGCEDRKIGEVGSSPRNLLHALDVSDGADINISEIISEALRRCGVNEELSAFIDVVNLRPFDRFDRATAADLFRDFYRPSNSSYEFNFSLMSKHALSRIYEKYVSILEFDEDDRQYTFISSTPTERLAVKTGAIYTPQFIAGFFARYLRDNMTPRKFRTLKAIDPACGSGIFLRTLLELQCNPLSPGTTPVTIRDAFEAISGIDRDPNACEATRLSLALLHLVAVGTLPAPLNVINGDAIRLALEDRVLRNEYGAVLANPPYVKLDHLAQEDRDTYKVYLATDDAGRYDAYVAFVKLCLETVEPGGFVCLVLPQVFLNAKNTKFLRKTIADEFYVRCLIDLTAVTVFEGVGTYNVLLIVQKRMAGVIDELPATISQVQEFVGPALQACLDGRKVQTPYYSVFDLSQSFFKKDEWIILGPEDIYLGQKIGEFRAISTYMDAKQGFVSGADSIFIIPKGAVPHGEERVYVDYLPDRKIARYALPHSTEQVLFYPFEGGKELTGEQLSTVYPQTWRYLMSHHEKLLKRRCVSAGVPWWRPERPRDPAKLLRPKVVCPHLMLTPRFAADIRGNFAVSHAPFLVAKDDKEEEVFVKFFCAVLNSSVSHWWITAHAPKYSRGYNRLEVSLVKNIPVPDPSRVPTGIFKELLDLVDKSLKRGASSEVDAQIDKIVCSLYGLTPSEQERLLGQGSV